MAVGLAFPPVRSLRGTISVPPSKSASNRAILLAALTATPVEIVRPLESDDTRALIGCLGAMGASMARTPDGLRVSGPLRGRGAEEVLLDAADSGTAARFLAAAAAATPGRFLLGGSKRLSERPMGELVDALRKAGGRIAYLGREGGLPLSIEGGFLVSGEVPVDASRSSQFVSALLLAAVAVDGGLRVRPIGKTTSGPYVAATVEVLREFGHDAADGPPFAVRRGAGVSPRYETPGDYSSALPLAAAVGAAGGEAALLGLRWPSSDADAGALAVLEAMGLSLSRTSGRLAVASSGAPPRPVSVAATEFPDAVPALAALAMLAPGESVFSGIAHLRWKESDRLAALETLGAAVEARVRSSEDSLTVSGPARPPAGVVRIETFRDHRIAMAAGILSVRLSGLLIEDAACVAKSYPAFFRDLESLAAR